MIEYAKPQFLSPAVITPMHPDCLGRELTAGVNVTAASATWTANLASYHPWFVQEPCTVSEAIWFNGTAVAGNVAIAIYDSTSALVPGNKIVGTAATAQSGTSVIQTAALTDTLITPGLKWIAHWASSGSSTFFRLSVNPIHGNKALGICSESVASDLPATATPVATTHSQWPVFGIMLSPRTLV